MFKMVQIKIDATKCDGCGTCVDICPVGVFKLEEKGGKKLSVPVKKEECLDCKACESQCPTGAIQVIS
jgi:NAD-dependent dihydropyrimidine dehydrogenase PreA subunit